MNVDFVYYFLYFVICLYSINLVGKIILSFTTVLNNNTFYRIFLELIFGLITIVVVFSIYMTGLLTVNVLFLIILIYYLLFNDRNILCFPSRNVLLNILRNYPKDLGIIIGLSLPFFFYEMIFIYDQNIMKIPYSDIYPYSNFTETLSQLGKENKFTSLNILFPTKFNGIVPYHYFELWTNAFISKLFHCSSLESLLLITYPILYTTILIGIAAFLEHYRKLSVFFILTILGLLFISGIRFPFYDNWVQFFDYNWAPESTPFSFTGQKYATVYVFAIWAVLSFFKNGRKNPIYILCLIPIVSTGLAPSIIGSAILYCLLNKFHKKFSKADNIKLLILLFLLIIAFYLLYFIIGKTSYSIEYLSESEFLSGLLADPFNIASYKFIYGQIAYRFSRTLIFYAPFIFLTILVYWFLIKHIKVFNFLIFLFLLIHFIGLMASGFATGLLDGGQLYSFTFPLINILIIFVFLYGLILIPNIIATKAVKFTIRSAYLVIFLLIAFNIYLKAKEKSRHSTGFSFEYPQKIFEKTSQRDVELAVYILPPEDYFKINITYIDVLRPGKFFLHSPGFRDIININSYIFSDSIQQLNHYQSYYLQNSPFFIFVRNQKEEGRFISNEQSQIDFIDQFSISYLFAKKESIISDLIANRIEEEIIDSETGERFIILRSN